MYTMTWRTWKITIASIMFVLRFHLGHLAFKICDKNAELIVVPQLVFDAHDVVYALRLERPNREL
jgi:hypothetical protein